MATWVSLPCTQCLHRSPLFSLKKNACRLHLGSGGERTSSSFSRFLQNASSAWPRMISWAVCAPRGASAGDAASRASLAQVSTARTGISSSKGVESRPGPFRIRVFQQNLGCIQIYPDISFGIFSPSNVREKRKTLLECLPHVQDLRGKTDEHKMLLRAGCRCLQNGALSESLFQSPWSRPSLGRRYNASATLWSLPGLCRIS